MTTAEALRRHEQEKLRQKWLDANHAPPIGAPRRAFEDWHQKWLASPEHAKCLKIVMEPFQAILDLENHETRS